MLEYDRVNISQGIDINRTSDSHESKDWYFFKIFLLISLLHVEVAMIYYKDS